MLWAGKEVGHFVGAEVAVAHPGAGGYIIYRIYYLGSRSRTSGGLIILGLIIWAEVIQKISVVIQVRQELGGGRSSPPGIGLLGVPLHLPLPLYRA